MRNQIKAIIAQKGHLPILESIEKSIRDFKRLDYSRGEIKETIRDIFFGLNDKIDDFIISKGY